MFPHIIVWGLFVTVLAVSSRLNSSFSEAQASLQQGDYYFVKDNTSFARALTFFNRGNTFFPQGLQYFARGEAYHARGLRFTARGSKFTGRGFCFTPRGFKYHARNVWFQGQYNSNSARYCNVRKDRSPPLVI